MSRPWLRELVSVIALVSASAVACASTVRADRAQQMADMLSRGSQRNAVHDRLMGTKPNLASLDPALGLNKLPAVVWIVDLTRCTGCFDTIIDWVQLEDLKSHDVILYISGEPTANVTHRLRALRRTRVVWTDTASASRIIGPVLPNTKLLLTANGVVAMVDSRDTGQECGWSFEAQVAELLGMEAARPIRSQ